MKRNTLTFDELEIQNLIEKAIKDGFKNDEEHEKDYWYKLFGNRDLKIYKSYQIDKPQFPCIVVSLSPRAIPAYANSSQIEELTRCTVRVEHYTQAVGKIGKRELGIMVNYKLKQILQSEFNVLILSNQELAYTDNTIYRRLIQGEVVFDNKEKVFYIGE